MPRVTITVTEKSPQPYRFDLKREIVTVGRGSGNDIVIGCGSVSGKHSEMHRVKGGYHLIDVGSTNGIKIDGIRHQTVVLHTGMTVKLGDVEFGFSLSEEELEVLASETEPTAKRVFDADEDFDEEENEDTDKKEKISEKTHSKADEKQDEDDDDLDKLPDLAPVRLNKRKEKEAQEAEKQKKAEKEERAKREERAKKEDRAEKREKREKPARSEKSDEYSESKSVSIGSGFILFTLIAAAAAFFYGASTRHEKDTGENLLKGIVNKEDAKNGAPAEVEEKADSGAE